MYKTIMNTWDFGGADPLKILHRDTRGLTKQAKWYVEYKSSPGHTFVSALFLGSGETYSSNLNGDYFPRKELKNHYKSFLNGHHFKHHDNEDPTKSFGDIVDVFFNPEMDRVEGIIRLDNEKNKDMVEKIEDGESVPLSMACKVLYDVCSVCGKESYTTADYCKHLKEQMNEIMEDGRKVFAINPNPEFFDISEVVRGADPTASTFRKVAALQHQKKATDDKEALLHRLAEIEKEIICELSSLDKKKVKKAQVNTLLEHTFFGIPLTPKDFDQPCGLCKLGEYVVGPFTMLLNSDMPGKYMEAAENLINTSTIYNPNIKVATYTEPIKIPNNFSKNCKELCKLAAINLHIASQNPNMDLQNLVLNSLFF